MGGLVWFQCEIQREEVTIVLTYPNDKIVDYTTRWVKLALNRKATLFAYFIGTLTFIAICIQSFTLCATARHHHLSEKAKVFCFAREVIQFSANVPV